MSETSPSSDPISLPDISLFADRLIQRAMGQGMALANVRCLLHLASDKDPLGAADIPVSNVRRCVKELVKSGHIDSNTDKVVRGRRVTTYFLTAAGKALVRKVCGLSAE